LRADDAAELRFDRLPEAIRAVGMLPAQVQADRLEVLRMDGVYHQKQGSESTFSEVRQVEVGRL